MWWGGFSEQVMNWQKMQRTSLNPHVVGRFFRGIRFTLKEADSGLNPHVVGRFFREQYQETYQESPIKS